MYCIVYKYLYSASRGIGQTEDLTKRERDKERGSERIDEQRRGGRRLKSDGPINAKNLVRKKKVLVMGRAERGSRDRENIVNTVMCL